MFRFGSILTDLSLRSLMLIALKFEAVLLTALLFAPIYGSCRAQEDPRNACPRPSAGSAVPEPADLRSQNGVLKVDLTERNATESGGSTRYCFIDSHGNQSPTLRLNPGDLLILNLKNDLSDSGHANASAIHAHAKSLTNGDPCQSGAMTATSTNLHFHGLTVPPVCHQDDVLKTSIQPSDAPFEYRFRVPANEPPGLYWYHPHIHGIAEAAVQGGASGAIIVGGIANFQPAVAGLPERVLVVRDQPVAGAPAPGGIIPSWDVTLNYVPIPYVSTPTPGFVPSIIRMQTGAKEFWRVSNSSADTILDLQLLYDNVAQPLTLVALDGVPIGSQDGTVPGQTLTQTDILIPPAGRAEFIVTAPSAAVKNAVFQTLNINTGPDGDNDPTRPLAVIQTSSAKPPLPTTEVASGTVSGPLFSNLATTTPTAARTLYFSEVVSDPSNPASPTNFFITVDGATPTLFDPNNPPAITTTQGSVEDWTIQNRAEENHEFHLHQVHFLLMAVNGVPVPPSQQQYYDTIQVPFWSGTGPYPSVTVRADFRGPDIGDFVYHCHILGHEDGGMMAIIRVLPPL
jgi:FtsP/CotA-like multicopper oxidase with cupredoxin domain